MKIIGVIPARYSSERLPGKPLIEIKGKILIQRVWEQAKRAKKLEQVIIATDDKRIFSAARSFGAQAIMTSAICLSGTERVAEVAKKTSGDVFINIQGDEPLISPSTIDKVASVFIKNKDVLCSTAIYKTNDKKQMENPNVVKVVVDKNNDALYFSRSIIPYCRDKSENLTYCKHIGIYGYRRDFLLKLESLKSPDLEKIEKLEQLKILWYGYKIRCVETDCDSIGVDTPANILKVERLL